MVKRNIPDWQISAFDKEHNSCVKTKPNNKDHNKEIKEVVDDFISVHGEMIKKRDPETYYSLMDKKLPKKNQKKEIFDSETEMRLQRRQQSIPITIDEDKLGKDLYEPFYARDGYLIDSNGESFYVLIEGV